MGIIKFILGHFSLPFVKSVAVSCFYIEKKSRLNNLHVIHTETCGLLPEKQGRIRLGYFDDYKDALNNGKVEFEAVKLCQYCCDGI